MTSRLKTIFGVKYPRAVRGRLLISSARAVRLGLWVVMMLLSGRYSCTSLLVFSFRPSF